MKFSDYLERIFRFGQSVEQAALDNFYSLLVAAWEDDKTVYIIGNGGSASTAEHGSLDLGVGSYARKKRSIKIIPLTSSGASITAVANDFSFNSVFQSQIDCLASPGDILIVISASGNSKNLIQALLSAREKSVKTIAVLGFDGGEISRNGFADLEIVVKTPVGEYGPVEDLHLSIFHYLTLRLRNESDE